MKVFLWQAPFEIAVVGYLVGLPGKTNFLILIANIMFQLLVFNITETQKTPKIKKIIIIIKWEGKDFFERLIIWRQSIPIDITY